MTKAGYQKILEKALLYYQKGRDGDVEHINWLYKIVPKFIDQSEVDFDVLIPVIILHDVGYTKVKKDANPYSLDVRRLHSEEGARIAGRILEELNFPKEKSEEVKRLILKHDDWAFGDSFSDEPILKIFTNFDFLWMASEKGFNIVRKFLNQTPQKFYKQIQLFCRKNRKEGRNWVDKRIEKYYHRLMKERESSLQILSSI